MHFTVIPAELVPSHQEWLLPAIGAVPYWGGAQNTSVVETGDFGESLIHGYSVGIHNI